MNKLERLRDNLPGVALDFRYALEAELDKWAALREIEEQIGYTEGMDDLTNSIAVSLENKGDVDAMTNEQIMAYLTPLMTEEENAYEITLENCGRPPVTATTMVHAGSMEEANRLALAMIFGDLEWTDEAGNVVKWEDVHWEDVHIAERG